MPITIFIVVRFRPGFDRLAEECLFPRICSAWCSRIHFLAPSRYLKKVSLEKDSVALNVRDELQIAHVNRVRERQNDRVVFM